MILGALALTCLLVLLPRLGTGSLKDFDEAIYAQVSVELLERDAWLTPTWNGALWFHKPPLGLWATSVFYRLFGVGEGSARLFSALCGLATVLGLAVFARRRFGARVALVAGLVLLSTPHFLLFARMGNLDAPLTLFVTLSVLTYRLGVERPRWFLACGTMFGLALLTKGMAAMIVPLICGLHSLLHRDWKTLHSPSLWAGGGLSLAIALPWHLYAWKVHGQKFLDEYLGYHVLERALSPLEGHAGGALYYLEALVKHQAPWVILTLFVVPLAIARSLRERDRDLSLLLLWAMVPMVLYSAVATKLHWYILPIHPALSLLIAIWLVAKVPRRRFRLLWIGAAVILALQLVVEDRVLDPDYEPEIKILATQAGELLEEDQPLLLFNLPPPTARFYAGRRVEAYSDASLAALAQVTVVEPRLCLTRGSGNLDRLSSRPELRIEILRTMSDAYLLRLFANAPR